MGNSSSTPSSSTTITTHGENYDVFLSFRGETRNGFTSHLYQALDEKQIKTFRDDQLVRGEAISEGLLSAIGESKISMIIFSENYTSSKWCLLELAEIMKYREMKKQIVIPVFYKVEPSDVRKSYKAAFAEHKNEWEQFQKEKEIEWKQLQKENKIEWGPALTKASSLGGIVVTEGRNEAEFVRDIVKDVWKKLYNISPSCDFEDLVEDLVKDYVGIEKYVGIDKHIVRVVSLLGVVEQQDFRIIGIWGMGGMGKTTIADVVFHIISHQFESRTYFTSSVREKDSTGLTSLRNKILSKVLKIENIEDQMSESPNIPQNFKKMLLEKKVLIVFDDVDSIEQLETLAGDLDRLGPGSRIIVTTRDKQVLCNCGVKDHNMYEVKGLNLDETLQLFCNHAFKQTHPKKDFEDLSRKLLKIATDVPLAIRVLGSLLYGKSKQYWEEAVDQFQGIKNPTIFDRLKISYNRLDEEESGLFLDIACFDAVFAFGRDDVFAFVRDEEDFRPNLLSNRMCFLDSLNDKSLVTVERGSIKMHDLLQEMGREIVDKESPNKPVDRSRLWRQEDVLHTLKHNDGTEAIQGIFLSMINLKDVYLGSQVFTKMCNLRTLIIKYGPTLYHDYSKVHLCIGDLDYLPDKLRYLHWERYPLEVLPSSFNPENLVELDLSRSQIKQLWEGNTHVPKLKWLRLVYCENLISIPDLSDIPSAEIINLNNCRSLIEIHSSRECPKNLHSLQLSFCSSLSRLPSNIHLSEEPSFSTSVVLHSSREGSKFSLRCCFRLTKFPHISGNIKSLDLSSSGVEEVPSTIVSLSKLESLNMVRCESLKRISESICKLKSLDRLDLSECCKLESFPDILEGMELKYLNLSGTAIKELPPSIGNLNRLEELDFIYGYGNLNLLPRLSGLCSLKILRLDGCNLTEISEDIGCLSSLEMLELQGNVFERLPKSIKQLSKLYYLSLYNCGMLRSLPELPSSLRYLEARNCMELIQSLPDESEIEFCADGCGSFIFNFMNCLKLNQKAVRNLFRDSVLKMQLMGTEKIISLFKVISPPPLPPSRFCSINTRPYGEEAKSIICLPGSEIPEWFSCYKNKGSSINIPGLRNDCGRSSYIMGFEVCLVFDLECAWLYSIDVNYDFHIETSDGHKERFFHNSIQLSGTLAPYSDHILLGYNLSRKSYEFFQELDTRLANRGMSDYVGTSFEFSIRRKNVLRPLKVRYCGIQPIYVKAQVMNSISINQNTGDTSGCNDTAEETCEPHPKRICTDANQFS